MLNSKEKRKPQLVDVVKTICKECRMRILRIQCNNVCQVSICNIRWEDKGHLSWTTGEDGIKRAVVSIKRGGRMNHKIILIGLQKIA